MFLHVFNNSIKIDIFIGKMKLAKVTSIFKSGKEERLTKIQAYISATMFNKNARENHVY